MNVVKNELRNRLTQVSRQLDVSALMCQLRTSINSYSPRFDNILSRLSPCWVA